MTYLCNHKSISSMKKTIVCMLVAALVGGCSQSEREAQALLEEARLHLQQNEFFAARSEIDSLRAKYPKEYKVLREALTLMRQVDLKEAERNIAFCDSLMPIRVHEADSLKAGFTFEKDTLYQEIGNYVWKGQTIERNVQH